MLTRLPYAIFAIGFIAACSPAAPAPETPTPETADQAEPALVKLDLAWRLEGLANPESAVLSSDGAFLYVTNVNGEGDAKDGNGFISKVSTDGKLLEREWVKGLNGPKGIALVGSRLHVADIDQLVTVDAETGAIVSRTPLTGAKFLNDTAIAPDGSVRVADSQGSRIYSVTAGAAEIWLEDKLLEAINGLMFEPGRLIVTTMAGRLLAIDNETKAITVLAEGLGDADGIANLGAGRYLVSEWPGLMHVVASDGTHATIMDTKAEPRLLNDFLLVGDTLYQPHWDPSEFSAYRVTGLAP